MLNGCFHRADAAAGRGADRPRSAAAALALSLCIALLAGCAGMGGRESAQATAAAEASIPPKDALPLD